MRTMMNEARHTDRGRKCQSSMFGVEVFLVLLLAQNTLRWNGVLQEGTEHFFVHR